MEECRRFPPAYRDFISAHLGDLLNNIAWHVKGIAKDTDELDQFHSMHKDAREVIEERWANWLRQDPVVAIETQASNLRSLKALYIDCGEKDQFNLLYGARRFVRRLNELGIAHRYEEFPDSHSGVDYRMDDSLPFLAQALSG